MNGFSFNFLSFDLRQGKIRINNLDKKTGGIFKLLNPKRLQFHFSDSTKCRACKQLPA